MGISDKPAVQPKQALQKQRHVTLYPQEQIAEAVLIAVLTRPQGLQGTSPKIGSEPLTD